MPKPPADSAYAEKLALYDKLVASSPSLERKGATMPYTALNGNMSSYLAKNGTLVLRLPEPQRSAFLKAYETQLSAQYGIVQKEYVDVPDALLKDTKALQKHFAVSLAYVATLKPKATAKAKKAK